MLVCDRTSFWVEWVLFFTDGFRFSHWHLLSILYCIVSHFVHSVCVCVVVVCVCVCVVVVYICDGVCICMWWCVCDGGVCDGGLCICMWWCVCICMW